MRSYKAIELTWSSRGVERIALLEREKSEAKALATDWALCYQEDMDAVQEMLGHMGLPNEAVAALPWVDRIDVIEKIDRVISHAEHRRNQALREIERHKSALAVAVRCATDGVVKADASTPTMKAAA
jgi:hypothetical protein